MSEDTKNSVLQDTTKAIVTSDSDVRRPATPPDAELTGTESELRYQWFSTLMVRHPFLVLSLVMSVCIASIYIISSQNLFRIWDNSDRDYDVRGDSIVEDRYKFESAQETVRIGSGAGAVQSPRSVAVERFRVLLMYRVRTNAPANTETMLTPARLAHVRSVENTLLSLPEWDKYCFAGISYPNCSSDALLTFTKSVPTAATQSQIDTIVNNSAYTLDAFPDSAQARALRVYFDRDFTYQDQNSEWMRSAIRFGGPLENFRNTKDREDDQRKQFYETWGPLMEKYVLDSTETQTDDVEVLFESLELLSYFWQKQVDKDLRWAFGSVLFVWLYMAFHMHSMFLGIGGMLQILLAFPLGFLIYKAVLGISIFQSLHGLSIFLLLGIGADDLFVMWDAWGQAAAHPRMREDMELRMAWSWRRAAKAMAITSTTTTAAFLTTGISKIIPISSFGFWAATLIATNFLLVVTMFPCIIVIYELYVKGCCSKLLCCCPCETCKKTENDQALAAKGSSAVELTDVQHGSHGGDNDDAEPASPSPPVAIANPDDQEAGAPPMVRNVSVMDELDDSQLRPVERFFKNTWSPGVYKYRKFILIGCVILIIAASYTALQITPLSEQERFFPDGHWIARSFDAVSTEFIKTAVDSSVKVHVVWGVAGIDDSNVDRFDPDDIGTVVWDSNFDVSSPAAQRTVIYMCDDLESSDLVLDGLVQCFMKDYRDWRITNGKAFPAVFSVNDAVVQRQNFTNDLVAFAKETLQTTLVDLIGEDFIGVDPDGNLRFVSITASAAVRRFLPYATTKPVYDAFNALVFARNANSTTPSSMSNAFQTAGVNWTRMVTEREFVANAVRGIAIALAVAFVVVMIATMNYVIALFCILTILAILACVTAIIVLQGWELGISESVAVVILVGISVDFNVHLASMYVHSFHVTRRAKMAEAFVEMGISILSGAITTFGSSCFLWGGVVVFFTKFAVIMMSTISFSLFFALVFFAALCFQFGPEGDTGSVRALYAHCTRLCPGSDTDTDTDTDKSKNKRLASASSHHESVPGPGPAASIGQTPSPIPADDGNSRTNLV
jgi:protein dispatched 1